MEMIWMGSGWSAVRRTAASQSCSPKCFESAYGLEGAHGCSSSYPGRCLHTNERDGCDVAPSRHMTIPERGERGSTLVALRGSTYHRAVLWLHHGAAWRPVVGEEAWRLLARNVDQLRHPEGHARLHDVEGRRDVVGEDLY